MLALPAPSAILEGVKPHFNLRKPLRVQALAKSKKGQTFAAPPSTCCFRSRQRLSHTVCKSASSDSAKHNQKGGPNLKSNLEKAALFSFAPLAVALPACFGYGGHDGSGNGAGGGDGDGSGGSGYGDSKGTNVIADIAEEEDDEEDDDEDEEEDEEVSWAPHC